MSDNKITVANVAFILQIVSHLVNIDSIYAALEPFCGIQNGWQFVVNNQKQSEVDFVSAIAGKTVIVHA